MRPLGAGDVEHDIEGGQRSFREIVVPCEVADLGHRAAPGDQENLVSLRDRVFDEGIPGAEIEQIILVDAGRRDQQRGLFDLGGLRLVLDQLDQVVFVDDGAGGGGEVAADLEGGFVDARDAALLEVVDQVTHTVGEARRAGFDRGPDYFRIGRRKVRRADGVDILAREEAELQLGAVVDLCALDEVLQLAGAQQVDLLEQVVIGLVFPRLVLEAPIAFRRGFELRRAGDGLQERRVPELPDLPEIVALHVDHQPDRGESGCRIGLRVAARSTDHRSQCAVELLDRGLARLHQVVEMVLGRGRRLQVGHGVSSRSSLRFCFRYSSPGVMQSIGEAAWLIE